MNFAAVDKIVHAVLYEGYILYPYRSSAVKNQQRFNFGVLVPQSSGLAQVGAESWSMQTECLVLGSEETRIEVRARFLHPLMREVREIIAKDLDPGSPDATVETRSRLTERLEVNGHLFQTWEETVEREICAPSLTIGELRHGPQSFRYAFPANLETEPLLDAGAEIRGLIVRRQQAIEGLYEILIEECDKPERSGLHSSPPRLYKLSVRIMNLTPVTEAEPVGRDRVLMQALASTHTIIGVHGGEFVSLLETPDEFQSAARGCQNIGTWPVLVGEMNERDLVLSSPIILYDYPQVAPESAGDLFDGTEIDEILRLRILTLTDEEKREMRSLDERTRKILERTEALHLEQWKKMHGTIRDLRKIEDESQ